MGLTSFSWYASGFLLALNTFGPQRIVTAVTFQGFGRTAHGSDSATKNVNAVFLFVRTLTAWVATCSAALQRRHLMVWALFAPKFVFDLCFLFMADLSVLAFAP